MATTIIKRSDKTEELTWAEMDQNLENLRTATDTHSASNTNPHNVTAAQAGAEPAGAVAAHEAAADPHSQYETSAEAQAKVDAHESAADPHPQYETSAEAQAKVDAHESAADPHPQYETSTEAQAKVDAHANQTGTAVHSLGTASEKDATTSNTDTTSDRVLRVGAGHEQLDQTLYRRGNILGAVGQSGGIPTGGVIERGSNANGEYVKFADGTLICRGYFGTSALTIGPDAYVAATPDPSWIFPAAFVSNPVVLFNRISSWVYEFTAGSEGVTPTLYSLIYVRNNGQFTRETTHSFYFTAIGRWY